MKRLLICVLCSTERTGWINPWLCKSLLRLQADPRFQITVEMVCDARPVEYARNMCVVMARQMNVDALVQIDNDMTLPADFGNILADALATGKHVVTLGYGALLPEGPEMLSSDNGPRDGQFRETGNGGGGVLFIASEVWKTLRGPWFRFLTNDDELLSRKLGEDYYFTEIAQSHGFKVWTHENLAGHLKTTDATQLCLLQTAKWP